MRRALPILLALALAGCGAEERRATTPAATGGETETAVETETGETEAEETELAVYLLRDGRVAPVRRAVPRTEAVAGAAVEQLLAGPTAEERGFGLASDLPEGAELLGLDIADGIATVELSGELSPTAAAQLTYTLTRFPTVRAVRLGPDAEALGRADYEEQTPLILVESPLPGEEVTTPIRVEGTANVYEANVLLTVVDWDGRILVETFTTATSGSGERGTFAAAIDVEIADEGRGAVIAVAPSAGDGDGEPIYAVEIPLWLRP